MVKLQKSIEYNKPGLSFARVPEKRYNAFRGRVSARSVFFLL